MVSLQSKHFSPRLQSIQPASQSLQAASLLTTTHLDKPSLQFAMDLNVKQDTLGTTKNDGTKRQPLRLNIKRGDQLTKKEMETIAIFNKFFKKSARDPKKGLEATLTNDTQRRAEETSSSHVELQNPVAPASGVDK